MTVAELIRDLQAMPNQHARVELLMERVWCLGPMGWQVQDLNEADAAEADDVRYMGSFVLIKSK